MEYANRGDLHSELQMLGVNFCLEIMPAEMSAFFCFWDGNFVLLLETFVTSNEKRKGGDLGVPSCYGKLEN